MASSLTFADDLGLESVNIVVGPGKKKFMVHKKLLASHSKFFQEKLKTTPDLGEVTSLHLEHDDPAAVALMINFLYRGVVPCWMEDKSARPTSTLDFTTTSATDCEKSVFGVLAQRPFTSNYGTASTPFQAFIENEPDSSSKQQNAFQNVCFQAPYQNLSPEELRLVDYKAGFRFSTASAVTSAVSFLPANFAGSPNFDKQPISNPFARAPVTGTWPFSQVATQIPVGPPLLGPAIGSFTPLPFSPTPAFKPSQTKKDLESTNIDSSSALSGGGFGRDSNSSSTPSLISETPSTSLVRLFATSALGPPTATETSIATEPSTPTPAKNSQEVHSLALLNLCILADRTAWPNLFNAAIKFYVPGIVYPGISIPVTHVETIYKRTKIGSPLRTFAIDCVSRFGADHLLGLAQENKDFLADVWGTMRPSTENFSILYRTTNGKYNLKDNGTNAEGSNT